MTGAAAPNSVAGNILEEDFPWGDGAATTEDSGLSHDDRAQDIERLDGLAGDDHPVFIDKDAVNQTIREC